MVDVDYRILLATTKKELRDTQKELDEVFERQETLENKIRGLGAMVAAISGTQREDLVTGLSDAIREVLRATGTRITPTEIKAKLWVMTPANTVTSYPYACFLIASRSRMR